ncbi:EAL domain-containing protein [Roseobacter sp. WL0113]|uniref:EAL domain-containing protein n=1 Tax=Roseobacter sinensis TaxID=2931391 RepID=A0ABT3BEV8_9RHOB|nr:EAL domain-containing protein [Roseobacter sp. WL0113]
MLIFLLVALGPLLLFRAWPHSEVLQGELDEVHERHLLLARNLAAALERYHRDLVTTFDLFAASQNDWMYTESTKRVLENLSFRHLCLADPSTGQVVDALAPITAPCPEVVPAELLSRLTSIAEPGVVSFGSVVEAPNGENVIHLVTQKGEHLVIGAIRTTYFRQLGEAISFGVMGHAAIVDHTGRALSHPLPDWVRTRKDMSKISAVQRMLNRETGVETFYSPALDGDMIAGFTFVDPVGWGVMIPQPISELYQRAEDARRSSLIVLAIGTATALLLAYFVALRVVRPLEQVSRASTAIAKGNFQELRPPKASRLLPIELSDLQEQFHHMVERLRENMTTINGLAYVDAITGLANRTFLQKCLDKAVAQHIEGTLFLIDLDGFKSINDVYGHDAGDKVLGSVAQRLSDILGVDRLADGKLEDLGSARSFDGSSVQVARMGGDEFAIWLPHADQTAVDRIAHDIVTGLREPMSVDGAKPTIGASVGTAGYPRDASDRTGLTKAADLALYDAKKTGKNRYSLFTPALRQALEEQHQLATEIKEGLENQEFVPFFQPQFSLPDRRFSGLEALARWQHPRRGLLEPANFITSAEDVGLLEKIDEVIFEQSIEMLLDLERSGVPVGSLAVNVSSDRLVSQDFHTKLDRLPKLPFELRFELVETMLLDQIEGRLAWTLDRIREDGHRLDLDDFGSANASVLGLMNVEPAHLKVDKKLIVGVGQECVAERLVRSIIEMSHSLDVPVIAEGAEDLAAVERLEEMNCDFVQGYALAMPMSLVQLRAFLQDYHQDRPAAQDRLSS